MAARSTRATVPVVEEMNRLEQGVNECGLDARWQRFVVDGCGDIHE